MQDKYTMKHTSGLGLRCMGDATKKKFTHLKLGRVKIRLITLKYIDMTILSYVPPRPTRMPETPTATTAVL